MEILVRHYLHAEPAEDMDDLVNQYVEAMWIEERQMDVMVAAIAKAMAHDGAFLIDFVVEPEENVYPIVPPGLSLVEGLEMPRPEIITSTK